MTVDRDRHGQFSCSTENGDCFRASLSVILDVPNGDHLPNDHTDRWWLVWKDFLGEFGLRLAYDGAQGPIWKPHRWIASVPSKNFEGSTHAIVMDHSRVLFDPSPKGRYRAKQMMLGEDLVIGGYWLELMDVTKLDNLVRFRRRHR